jgi:purine-binding chemotaxis protein CheW
MTTRPPATLYLTFLVHGDEYAVELTRVREILELLSIARVPSTPPAIRGVAYVRGNMLPVVDLAVRFGLGELAVTRWTCVVVVNVANEGAPITVGLLVDRVSQLIDLDPARLAAVPNDGASSREWIRGSSVIAGRRISVLDVDHTASSTDLRAAFRVSGVLAAKARQGAPS